ncbi:hypothetical protein G3480_20070 [Thiorhodococcus mannitoliphagus]|uniref:Uncharacterized protein n=1 Tax=Thiorhodococcus mannitoliphagus TaxID=329406 RepID=A0A6P1E3H1_9GAMM|nr:hypothetical protein [Thiorhodococcus mannitoliphagus]NEX22574.1 hypothetical protein [Thiorhodococcus mannitoliphagus]
MDESDTVDAAGIDLLLDRWRGCLDRWLQTGCASPSAAARAALDQLLDEEGSAEWPQVRRLAQALSRAEDVTAATAAFLDLLVWIETMQRLRDADRLAHGRIRVRSRIVVTQDS